jgi:hypothetical protein
MNWKEKLANNLLVEGMDYYTRRYRFYKTAAKKMAKREKELRGASIMDRKDNKERVLASQAKTKNNKIANEFLALMKFAGRVTRDRSKK